MAKYDYMHVHLGTKVGRFPIYVICFKHLKIQFIKVNHGVYS